MSLRETLYNIADQLPNNKRSGPWFLPSKRCVFATDGRLAIFANPPSDGWLPPPAEPEEEVKCLKAHSPVGVLSSSRCSLSALKEFAGAVEWPTTCKTCLGKPESCRECLGRSAESEYVTCDFCHNNGVKCADCEDKGKFSPDERYGVVMGQRFNLHYLARGLEPFAGDTVQLTMGYPVRAQDRKAMWIVGDGWRIAVMTMEKNESTDELFKGAKAFDTKGI